MKSIVSLLPLAALAVSEDLQPQIPLSPVNGLTLDTLPRLGFGTWNLKEGNTSEAVSYAIRTGYRHIDCAAAYGNEQEVGKGIRDGLARAGLQREDIWVTSKLWNDKHDINQVEGALDASLHKLGLTYLDLYHMHWPVADKLFGGKEINYLDAWSGMVLLKAKGKTRHIGISNFSPKQLEDLLNHTSIPPEVHQMELHPYLQQNEWIDFHKNHSIHVTAYSPLGGTNPTYGKKGKKDDPEPLLKSDVIHKIAKKRDCSPAQVVLQWGLLRGTSVIPKSVHKNYIKENFKATECSLKEKDIKKIDKLGKYHHRYNNPSESWEVPLYEGLEDEDGKHRKSKFWLQ
ncbi:hypothetical protein DOTSEDRAFT_52883 [Dothistroma septosporum NZE10]|uniref:NADP-dependent oxidoreductase domain-containing protein n=1 Tax=Dothistroma septosporum (strain NZE10 / CBS 128990) TaxID=675120 RepID=N1PTI1_DOTSN|nr:hypothetical protein DOTSEDRAFT_52883 [Dothistroma septosporum NZE10]